MIASKIYDYMSFSLKNDEQFSFSIATRAIVFFQRIDNNWRTNQISGFSIERAECLLFFFYKLCGLRPCLGKAGSLSVVYRQIIVVVVVVVLNCTIPTFHVPRLLKLR